MNLKDSKGGIEVRKSKGEMPQLYYNLKINIRYEEMTVKMK